MNTDNHVRFPQLLKYDILCGSQLLKFIICICQRLYCVFEILSSSQESVTLYSCMMSMLQGWSHSWSNHLVQ